MRVRASILCVFVVFSEGIIDTVAEFNFDGGDTELDHVVWCLSAYMRRIDAAPIEHEHPTLALTHQACTPSPSVAHNARSADSLRLAELSSEGWRPGPLGPAGAQWRSSSYR